MSSTVPNSRTAPVPEGESDGRARISNINVLLNLFADRLNGVLEYDSFDYECPGHPQIYAVGTPQAHQCSYRLSPGEGSPLGRVTFTRATPFRESELQLLEALLADFCGFLQAPA